MRRERLRRAALAGFFILTIFVTPIHADGGPIVQDPQVWVHLEEGTQVAVVRLDKGEAAQVDLFVSLRDTSGQSHEITFFIPLGSHPTAFDVTEERFLDFQAAHTDPLDQRLHDAVQATQWDYRDVVGKSIFGTVVLMPGPFALAFTALSGDPLGEPASGTSGEPAPLATFQTAHSLVALYELEADTNLQALIATAGLTPAVQETLRRLEGQQVAVVTLQTSALQEAPAGGAGGRQADQPGLHLTWAAQLVPPSKEGTYTYPLGTGGAWAHPIELTSVYVVAPSGVDFRIDYPRLGKERSGYVRQRGRVRPRILSHLDTPAYSVEQALGGFGRVWRVIYAQSNAVDDITITRVEGLRMATRVTLLRQALGLGIRNCAWLVGPAIGLILWVLIWHLVMSQELGLAHDQLPSRLWAYGIGWMMVEWVFRAGSIALFGLVENSLTGFLLFSSYFGLVSGGLFVFVARQDWGVSLLKAARAYTLVIFLAGIIYMFFAAFGLRLVGSG